MRIVLIFVFTILYQLTLGQETKTNLDIDNVHKLCKVWGFVKYYHPAVTKGKYDWDNQLLKYLPEVVSSSTLGNMLMLLN